MLNFFLPPFGASPIRTAPKACLQTVDLSPNPPSPFLSFLTPPPKPILLSRPTLDQPFAVLLLRSGYNAVDDLDIVPMDQFQRHFFQIRSEEWQKFIRTNIGMRQGIVSDPRYFDFISYAQMLTVQLFMRHPLAVFEEKYSDQDGNFGIRVVKRDTSGFQTPQTLLKEWARLVGVSIYQRMLDTVHRPQPVQPADIDALVVGVTDMYDYMEVEGFSFKTSVSREQSSNAFEILRVEMVLPCILWGAKALRRKKSIPNDYDCFAVLAFCERSGVHATYQSLTSENSLTRIWSFA